MALFSEAKEEIWQGSLLDKEQRDIVAELQRFMTEGIGSGVSTRTPEGLLQETRPQAGIAQGQRTDDELR